MFNSSNMKNIMRKNVILLILILSAFLEISCEQDESWKYYNETPPGKSAELFAPEIINHLAHSSPSFTPDGREFYWSTVSGNNETRKIYYVKYENNKWTEPILANFSGNFHDDQPFISHDGIVIHITMIYIGLMQVL